MKAHNASLGLTLFGAFQARIDGRPLPPLRSKKGQWLLALLALRHGSAVDRSWLAGRLWPESTEDRALAALRTTLNDLRRAMGTEAWRIQAPTQRTLSLNLEGATADIVELDDLLDCGTIPDWADFERIWGGPLLEGCTEDWVFEEREARELTLLSLLETHAEASLRRGDRSEAVSAFRRLVSLDPLRESAVRNLMVAEAQAGNYGAAIGAYRDLRERLMGELRADPDPETRRVFESIRRRQRIPSPRRPRLPDFSIPRPITTLIGREGEVAAIASKLRENRLITVTGPGGIGKTRVALEVAEEISQEFINGACFVELASVSYPNLILANIASKLGFRGSGEDLKGRVVGALRFADLLLVLDNCEHLLEECAATVSELLQASPGLRILATSREPLGITGEVRWRLPALTVPPDLDGPTMLEKVSGYEAIRLFADRGSQVEPRFSVNEQTIVPVVEICRKLDGLPLAIELAAANLSRMAIRELAEAMNDRLGTLAEGGRTDEPRHRSLRGLLDWSYGLLSEEERLVLCSVSVFANPWSIESAAAVCPPRITPRRVSEIVRKLVAQSQIERLETQGESEYRLLETVREFALEQLSLLALEEETWDRHLGHFSALADRMMEVSAGPEQAKWIWKLARSIDDLRLALSRSIEVSTGIPGDNVACRFACQLHRFWYRQGMAREGMEWYKRVLSTDPTGQACFYRANALGGAGSFAYEQGDYATARRYFSESLSMSRSLNDTLTEALGVFSLSHVIAEEGDFKEAKSLVERAMPIAADAGLYHHAVFLGRLGLLQKELGDLEEAEQTHRRRLEMDTRIGHGGGQGASYNNLANLALAKGRLPEAIDLLIKALETSAAVGDFTEVEDELKVAAMALTRADAIDDAIRLFAASESLRRANGTPLKRCGRPERLTLEESLRAAVPVSRWNLAFDAGMEMRPLEAVENAVSALRQVSSCRKG